MPQRQLSETVRDFVSAFEKVFFICTSDHKVGIGPMLGINKLNKSYKLRAPALMSMLNLDNERS